MTDIVDETKSFTIELTVPEGKAVITKIDAPDSAKEGDVFNIVMHVRNDGGTDVLFGKLSGDITGATIRKTIPSGGSDTFSWSVTMPGKSITVTAEAGHEE